MKLAATALIAAIASAPGLSHAAGPVRPAVVYDTGGKYDKSFNESVSDGAARFRAETGIGYAEAEPRDAAQIEQALRRFAQRGYSPILAVGFAQATAVAKVAGEFPASRFTIIDADVRAPNVRSVLFKEHEGSFLAGALAALASHSGMIGFVGGMDVPLVREFACGYAQGGAAINPAIRVLTNFVGATAAAWRDPVAGGELAKSQIEAGADVIFQVAGGSGLGVLQAAADKGVLGIGVDSNQDALHPGHMLTSMLKRADLAAHDTFLAARDDTWHAGVSDLGLSEGGVGLAFDAENRPLLGAGTEARIGRLAAAIRSGRIVVHDYLTDHACPVN